MLQCQPFTEFKRFILVFVPKYELPSPVPSAFTTAANELKKRKKNPKDTLFLWLPYYR